MSETKYCNCGKTILGANNGRPYCMRCGNDVEPSADPLIPADRQHLESLAATIAAGMLSSWHEGGAGRVWDARIIAEDSLGIARAIIKDSARFMPGWPDQMDNPPGYELGKGPGE